MSHSIESMAYAGQVPWHGLGEKVDSDLGVDQMLIAAGIDWEVELVPMNAPTNFTLDKRGKKIHTGFTQQVHGFFALRRSSDNRIFDVTGKVYTPTQNRQAFEFFTGFVEAGDAKMETAGSLKGGKYVWGLANLSESFVLDGNDRVDNYVLVGCPHEQGKSLIFKRTAIRVVCHNTLTAALRDRSGEFRFAHRSKFGKYEIRRAKEVLGLAREDVRQFEIEARALVEREIKLSQALSILIPIMSPKMTADRIMDIVKDPKNTEIQTPRVKALMNSYHNAPGATPGNVWGVLNAVTHYADHVASRTQDMRLANAWFGKTAAQKQRVFSKLMELTV